MDALELLPVEKRTTLAAIVEALAALPGMVAVGLGGSYARGAAHADSDVDLGLYYDDERPFAIAAVRAVAQRFETGGGTPAVTGFYEWGPWVNGGAWLHTAAGRVDFLYRSVQHVERVIDACERGEIEWHFAQQPPYGFRSVIYLAETSICLPLHDPRGMLRLLRERVATYPEALRTAIVRSSLWSAEFTLFNAQKIAAAGDLYATAGCLTRAACELTQVLFALNRRYFISDRGALAAIDSFPLRPQRYGERVGELLASPGADAAALVASVQSLAALIRETAALASDVYQPRFVLP